MNRLPDNRKLKVDKTFESQREDANKYIIPVVQKSLNKKVFPVVDGIIKHIIHERHRHQRELYLRGNKSPNWNDRENRRKYANTRRGDVSINNSFIYSYLVI